MPSAPTASAPGSLLAFPRHQHPKAQMPGDPLCLAGTAPNWQEPKSAFIPWKWGAVTHPRAGCSSGSRERGAGGICPASSSQAPQERVASSAGEAGKTRSEAAGQWSALSVGLEAQAPHAALQVFPAGPCLPVFEAGRSLPLCPLTVLQTQSGPDARPRAGDASRSRRDKSEPHKDGGCLRHPWGLQTPVFSSRLPSDALAGCLRPFRAASPTSQAGACSRRTAPRVPGTDHTRAPLSASLGSLA